MKGPRKYNPEHLAKIKEHIFKLNDKKAIVIEIFDIEKNIKKKYPSIRAASRELNCAEKTIKRYLTINKPFLDRYLITGKIPGV